MAFSRSHPKSRRNRDGWTQRYWRYVFSNRSVILEENQDERQGFDDKSTSVADSTEVAARGSLAPPSRSENSGRTRDRPEKIDGNAGDREGETAGEEVTEDLDAIFREVRGR
jgi:hypothetical protein